MDQDTAKRIVRVFDIPGIVRDAERKLIERMIADAGEKTTVFHPDTSDRISLFGSHRERLTNWLSSYLPIGPEEARAECEDIERIIARIPPEGTDQ